MPTATASSKTTLAAAEARIAELEATVKHLKSCELSTTIWVNDKTTTDVTKGGKPVVKFSGQKSAKTQDGGRVYGCYHGFVAYGEMADRFQELASAGVRLMAITAFESPWTNGARRSDWVVLSLKAYEKAERCEQEAIAALLASDPIDDPLF
jgi:hypothetical protein